MSSLQRWPAADIRAPASPVAANDWLAAREADLLPVGYFHVVFTLPAEIAPIAFQNKAIVYDLLFRTAAETLLTILPSSMRWSAGRAGR